MLLASCGASQSIRFGVVLASNVGDGERKRPDQLVASPVQRIEARTPAAVFACHLAHNHLGVGIYVERFGFQCDGKLQCFQQCQILSDVVVLPSNPLGDADLSAAVIIDDDANTRRTWIAQRPTIDVSHQIRHLLKVKVRKKTRPVKLLQWFLSKKALP